MTRTAFLTLLLAVPSPAQESIRWEGDLAAALAAARTTGRPVMIAINMDGENANDQTASVVYRDRRVVERSTELVCLVASKFDHPAVKEGEAEVCSRFGSVSCAGHKQVEKDARRDFLGGRAVVDAPQHLFVKPDGTLLFARKWKVSASRLGGLMERAIKESGKSAGAAPSNGGTPESLKPPAEPFEKAKWSARFHAKSTDEVRAGLREAVALDRPEAQALLEEEFGRAGADDDRVEFLRAMGQPGYERALPFLLKTAAGRDRTQQRHAIVSIEIIGNDAAAEPLFQAAKKETEKTVLKELLRAVARLSPGRKEVADFVFKRAADAEELIRGNALVAAADLADGARAREALRKALDDKSTDVRGCAIYALGLVGEPADVGRLTKLEEKEPDFRLRMLIGGSKILISTEGSGDPPREYRMALLFFAHDEIPHDGTWPVPRMGGRRGF